MNSRRHVTLAACLAAFLLAASPSKADVIYLDNGQSLSGIVRARENGRAIIELPTGNLTIPESRIARIDEEGAASFYLRVSREKADQGELKHAREALEQAESSGAAPEKLAEARAFLATRSPKAVDEATSSSAKAREYYDQAVYFLDHAMALEAADAMESAHHLDPENPRILAELLNIDYSLYLRGQMPQSLVQQTAQKLMLLDPGSEEAQRIVRLASLTEATRQAEREDTMETLRQRIDRNYTNKNINDALMDDIRHLLALDPDQATLLWLNDIRKEIGPILAIQSATRQAAEIKAAQVELARQQDLARREADQRAQAERDQMLTDRRDDAQRRRR